MARVKKLKMKQQDGNLSDYIDLGADAVNIDMADGTNLQDTLDNFETLPAGGTEGQILTKVSDTDGDAEWATITTGKDEIAVSDEEPTEEDIELWIDLSEDYDANAGGAGSQVEIVDSLDSESTTAALSANQGKVLNDKIENLDIGGNSSNNQFYAVRIPCQISNNYAGGSSSSNPYGVSTIIPADSGFSSENSDIIAINIYSNNSGDYNKTFDNTKYEVYFTGDEIEIMYNWTGKVPNGSRWSFYIDVILMKVDLSN